MEQVDPENTSWRCSHCGFTHPDNRSGEASECQKCTCETHADYNTSRNIGLQYLRRNQTGSGGGALVGVHLNNGTLNMDGGHSPAEESIRTGVHAESHDFTRGELKTELPTLSGSLAVRSYLCDGWSLLWFRQKGESALDCRIVPQIHLAKRDSAD
ncbi:MAG: transposase [Haloquadratum sp. J07HQX50]|nr:MAG: transposase [Haloquadratum sp. J07HQX50]